MNIVVSCENCIWKDQCGNVNINKCDDYDTGLSVCDMDDYDIGLIIENNKNEFLNDWSKYISEYN